MSPLHVGVPDEAFRDRLAPTVPYADVEVWRFGDPAPAHPFDLLVLEYMAPPARLRALAGVPARVLQSQSLGYDGVADHLPAGFVYCNAVGVHEASTGELALALVLAAQRGLPAFVRAQGEGRWAHAEQPGLAGRRVLLLGVGGVGEEVRARLAPFDVDLVRVARTPRTDAAGEVLGTDRLDDELARADIVVLAVPLTDATTGLVSDRFLERMPDGALLVNVSRGPVVDTDALVRNTASGRLRAAIDVTDPEPLPPGHPLWSLENVLVTPHVGGHTGAMAARIDRVVRDQLERLARGDEPAHVVVRT